MENPQPALGIPKFSGSQSKFSGKCVHQMTCFSQGRQLNKPADAHSINTAMCISRAAICFACVCVCVHVCLCSPDYIYSTCKKYLSVCLSLGVYVLREGETNAETSLEHVLGWRAMAGGVKSLCRSGAEIWICHPGLWIYGAYCSCISTASRCRRNKEISALCGQLLRTAREPKNDRARERKY